MDEESMDMDLEVYDEEYESMYDDLGTYGEEEVVEPVVTHARSSIEPIQDSSVSRPVYAGMTTTTNPFGFAGNVDMGVAIAVPVISLIITILVFILVVEKKKAPRNGFVRWLREYLNFRSILISGIIKFVYLFSAVALTISSFMVMTQGGSDSVLEAVLFGLAMLIFGNILLRIVMEMMMIMIGLWKNTSDMRAVIVRDDEKPEGKEPREPEEPEKPVEPEKPMEPEKPQESSPVEEPQRPEIVEQVQVVADETQVVQGQ